METSFFSTESQTQMQNESGDIPWSTILSIIYFALNVILVVILSIYIHQTEQYEKKKDLFKAIWKRKGIYGQILAHLYDTATDVGVLIEWGTLAYDDINYESIDMHAMFWTSIGFLILYRFLCGFYGYSTEDGLVWNSDGSITDRSDCSKMRDFALGLADLFILRTIYLALKHGHEEPTPKQKAIQLLEAVFESLPQVQIIIRYRIFYNTSSPPTT